MPVKKSASLKTKSLKLSKVVEGFILASRARRLSEHTISDYAHTYRIFIAHVGDTPIGEITSTQVTAFLAAQPRSEKTILNYHVGLSALWTWAINEGYAEEHIIRKVARPKPKQIVIEPLTELEIRALFTGLRKTADRDRAMLLLMLDTGVRVSELCGLTRKDIDLAAHKIKVLGKGNKERLLPFGARTASALFKHIASLADDARPFPLSRHAVAQHLERIAKRSGVKDCHPHKLRHTWAILFIRNGGDPYTLQEMLGHTTMEMTKVYLKIAQTDIETAHRKASPVENLKL